MPCKDVLVSGGQRVHWLWRLCYLGVTCAFVCVSTLRDVHVTMTLPSDALLGKLLYMIVWENDLF